ncbi:MAG: helicase associated domain-containing protein [Verrucomicrobiota bacterium]
MPPPPVKIGSWEYMFRMLTVFQRTHQHCNVPFEERPGSLGRWLHDQIADAKASRLPLKRCQRLATLGVVLDIALSPSPQHLHLEVLWEKRFTELLAYQKRFGHTCVPSKWSENPALGAWVHCQRAYRKKNLLAANRIAQLSQIGFAWSAPDRLNPMREENRDKLWRHMFDQLQRFRQGHGHCRVPSDWPENPGLGQWVQSQRLANRKGRLRPDRKALLEGCGFAWQDDNHVSNERWQRQFDALLAFKARFAHTLVPSNWAENNSLGAWVYIQRAYRRKNLLSPDRIARLDAIGFTWSGPGRLGPARTEDYRLRWELKFEQLRQFKESHGHCQPAASILKERSLADWVKTQRAAQRAGRLDPAHKERLDAIGFSWSVPGRLGPERTEDYRLRWELKFEQLRQFKESHGHCRPAASILEDRSLADWVQTQRAVQRAGRLDPARKERLDALGFDWKPAPGGRVVGLTPAEHARLSELHHAQRERLWGQRLAELAAFREQHGHICVPAESPLGTWLAQQRKAASRDQLVAEKRQRLANLGVNWLPLESTWERHFQNLCDFHRQHGHFHVPSGYAPDPDLYDWQYRQRYLHRHGSLREDRKQKFEALGWTSSPGPDSDHEAKWEKRFAELLAFKERHGHFRVATRHGRTSLGIWLGNQRQLAAQGKLSPDRRERLVAAGVQFGRFAPDKWQSRYEQLVAFIARHGHCHVPCDDLALGKLFNWISVQRTVKRLGKLGPERLRMLEAIGFEWNTSATRINPGKLAHWERMYAALVEYQRQHGHTLVPFDCEVPAPVGAAAPASPLQLGRWVAMQRQAFGLGKIKPERQRRLNDLGFVWNTLEAGWKLNLQALQTFRRDHGHCQVSQRLNPELAVWVFTLRQQRKDGKLSAERIRQLDELGFAWQARNLRWEHRFAELLHYQQTNGHCNVPAQWKPNPALAGWVDRQRQGHARGTLGAEFTQRLEAIGFSWKRSFRHNPEADARWEKEFQALANYQRRHGSLRVPRLSPKYSALARWIYCQRRIYRQKLLRPDRQRRLETIGFFAAPAPAA